MAIGWRWMAGWWGAGFAIVVPLLLTRSLDRIIGRICRRRDEKRSGTLEILSRRKDANFEIIAVPGLGAHPYHTWEARKSRPNTAEYQTVQPPRVHLLKDLLAHEFPDARIWNFSHESNWLIDAPVKTTEEIGKCLLKEIKDKRSSPHLPIIFIGHSLGGIIIKQALCRSDSQDVIDNTTGIIFLGTPHEGSSVSVAGGVLASVTSILGSDTTLLLSLKNHDTQLSNLADAFSSRIAPKGQQRKVTIISFYETKKTYLLGLSLGVVVSRDSAKVHADGGESHSVETDHSGLNKCGALTDTLFTELAAAIRRLKKPSLLKQADTWIHEKHYTEDRLKIERLSGTPLSMDQCYINLTIVEQSGQDASHSKQKGDSAPSPFSILARQKVEAPDKTMHVELAAIFNERNGRDGRPMLPRKILIRGRAGVGKTTLCKKIVHEFKSRKWNDLFERVLWVPLRNLKLPERRSMPKYTFKDLCSHEFLLPDGQDLAGALSHTWDNKDRKTLFLLDGLDEVSQDLTGNGAMARFLEELLRQPNVVITSRPSAKPPPDLDLDLELETIGFDQDQVNQYIEKAFTNPKTAEIDQIKIDKVQSFLRERWLIQGLVRIPIQLDALCYTWDDLKPDSILNTMTGMYKEIELKLWKKDVLRLEKKHDGERLTKEYLTTAGRRKIERFVKNDMVFVESLAFTGLHNDVIDFTSEHLNSISDHFTPHLLLDKTMPSLSFLRTSDPSSEYRNRNYHFIHLTFQEYFAARYFVRQWNEREGQLQFLTLGSKDTATKASPPAEFLRKQKYTVRYDIFWRFVAGLLDGSGQATDFIHTIEGEPLDLLGPTHQRLVMHCLSEISNNVPTRQALEKRLTQWLLFECKFNKSASLAGEVEFPELALKSALVHESTEFQSTILRSLAKRASISRSIIEQVAARLDDGHSGVREAATRALGGRVGLPDDVLRAVAAQLDDQHWSVRGAAARALGGCVSLPDEVLRAVAARLDDEHRGVRDVAAHALGGRAALPDEVLRAVAARLGDEHSGVRGAAARTLGLRAALPDELLRVVAARLGDEHSGVREAAARALGGRATLPDEVLRAVAARLDDNDSLVRGAAARALGGCVSLPDEVLRAVAARLDNEHRIVRRAAAHALCGRAALPDEVLRAVAARLGDDDSGVRRTAVHALRGRARLPDEVLRAVAVRLGDEHWLVRSAAVWALGGRAALPDEVLRAVAARLDDEHRGVRDAAAGALGGRTALPDEVLGAVAARLDDDDSGVRRTAVSALGGRASLPDEVLGAVAVRLNDDDSLVRRAAVSALGGRAALPDEVLRAVAARLDDNHSGVRRAAVDILMRAHDKLYRIILNGPLVTSLYKALLERSFDEQLSWYFEKDNSCINMPARIREFSINAQHQNNVRDRINEARPPDYPPTNGGESSSDN